MHYMLKICCRYIDVRITVYLARYVSRRNCFQFDLRTAEKLMWCTRLRYSQKSFWIFEIQPPTSLYVSKSVVSAKNSCEAEPIIILSVHSTDVKRVICHKVRVIIFICRWKCIYIHGRCLKIYKNLSAAVNILYAVYIHWNICPRNIYNVSSEFENVYSIV